ncbi:hypothetical protein MPSEU_000794100 [Mayamaea pseudoterrestris]|nr:hypothetical protein MPSEU_000794100 [Mayamaea pseudoterrestris]
MGMSIQKCRFVCLMLLLLRSSLSFTHYPIATRAKLPIFKCILRTMSSSTFDQHGPSSFVNCPSLKLRDGTKHPIIGFGTYKVGYIPPSASAAASSTAPTRSAEEIIKDALEVGYRFLECAQFYNNEREIGNAITQSGIPRDELFLCSKVWTSTIEQGPDAVCKQLEQTLSDLRTDYLDLYLIHWPVPKHHVTAYKTLIELKRQGKIRNIGVSNYAWEDFLELKQDESIHAEDLPAVNQIEINPFLYRSKTIELFQQEGVVMQSYRSLRDGKAFDHPVVQSIAKRQDKTPAQILGRWCVQKGFAYVPKSARKERMVENGSVFDFQLSEDDVQALDELTTPEAKTAFLDLYRKCVNRDTSKDGTMEGVKMEITVD